MAAPAIRPPFRAAADARRSAPRARLGGLPVVAAASRVRLCVGEKAGRRQLAGRRACDSRCTMNRTLLIVVALLAAAAVAGGNWMLASTRDLAGCAACLAWLI